MSSKLLEILAPSLPSVTAEARLSRQLLTTHILFILAIGILIVINTDEMTRNVSLAMIAWVGGLLLLMRFGHIQLVRALSPFGVYVFVSYMISQGFGIYSISEPGLVTALLLASLFGSRFTMLVYLGLCIFTVVMAFYLEGLGYIDNGRNGTPSSLVDLANVCIVLLTIGGLLWVLIGGMQTDRDEAFQKSDSLEESSRLLMEETAIRLHTESSYRLLAENASDFIWTTDMQLNYTYCSPSCVRLTGHKAEELIGEPALKLVHEDDQQMLESVWQTEAAEEIRQPGSRQPLKFEIRLVREDGSLRWVESTMAFLREDGMPIGIVGSSRDIHERVKLQARERDVANQLRQSQKMESIGQLAGAVAHDFNNLLLAIQGYAELIRHSEDKPTINEYAGELVTASQRAANLTRQLLTFSRQHSMETNPVDLLDLVTGLADMLSRLMPENVSINITTQKGVFPVMGDHGQLEQVITNLCVNARDAIEGDGRIDINLGYRDIDHDPQLDAGKYVCLVVSDTGKGMSEGVLERIFDPFFTTKEVGKGTGLGMSVVHGIVAEHGGAISVESAPDAGSAVTILLPQLKTGTHEHYVNTPHDTRIHAAGHGQIILVVEDEALVRKVVTKILTKAGYRVLEATDGQEGVRLFRQNQDDIALLLCDAVMPGGTGQSMVSAVRDIDSRLPIILMSGYKGHDVLEMSDVEFIGKPFSASELLSLVEDKLRVNMVAGK